MDIGTEQKIPLPKHDTAVHSGKLSANDVEIIQKIVFKVILDHKVGQNNTIRL